MPFFSTNQLSIPNNADSILVSQILIDVEMDLRNLGFVFELPTLQTRILQPDKNYSQSVFDMNIAFKDVQGVYIKDNQFNSQSLSINIDFDLICHEIDGYFRGINLIKCAISTPHYLEIIAKFGIYIDINSTTDLTTKYLKSIIEQFIVKALEYSSNNHQTITNAKSGESSVSYSQSRQNEGFSIKLDPEFKARLANLGV